MNSVFLIQIVLLSILAFDTGNSWGRRRRCPTPYKEKYEGKEKEVTKLKSSIQSYQRLMMTIGNLAEKIVNHGTQITEEGNELKRLQSSHINSAVGYGYDTASDKPDEHSDSEKQDAEDLEMFEDVNDFPKQNSKDDESTDEF
ncbi:uncharacterized protein LOC120341478 [Styela clava]